jgi:hypothetical protein
MAPPFRVNFKEWAFPLRRGHRFIWPANTTPRPAPGYKGTTRHLGIKSTFTAAPMILKAQLFSSLIHFQFSTAPTSFFNQKATCEVGVTMFARRYFNNAFATYAGHCPGACPCFRHAGFILSAATDFTLHLAPPLERWRSLFYRK